MASIKKREREAHRRTILAMLQTTPATMAHRPPPSQPAEPIPDLDFDWQPRPLARTVEARRTYRWPIVVGAALVGAAVLAGASYLLSIPPHRAAVRQGEYLVATDEFGAALDRLASAATVTDPDTAADFAAATLALRSTAEPPLPWTLPLLPGPDLAPARSQLLAVIDTATALSAEVTQAARYRRWADEILATPPLPYSAPLELIDPAAKALAAMGTASRAAAGQFDDDPAYQGFRGQVADALEGLPRLIDRYLLALRRGDTATATTVIGELEAQKALMESELQTVFARVDEEASAAIVTLRTAVEAARLLAS